MASLLHDDNHSNLRILIIDDEYLITGVLERLFEQHELTIAHSGDKAIDLLAKYTFDVVLCDVVMPTMSGIEIYNFCCEQLPGLENRIVFMSGGPANPDICDALEALPNPCIDKPFNLEELFQVVEERNRYCRTLGFTHF